MPKNFKSSFLTSRSMSRGIPKSRDRVSALRTSPTQPKAPTGKDISENSVPVRRLNLKQKHRLNTDTLRPHIRPTIKSILVIKEVVGLEVEIVERRNNQIWL